MKQKELIINIQTKLNEFAVYFNIYRMLLYKTADIKIRLWNNLHVTTWKYEDEKLKINVMKTHFSTVEIKALFHI